MKPKQVIELHVAYVWDCDECGTENFERAIVAEFSEEDRSDFIEQEGEAPQPGNWMTRPNEVKCKSCGAEFDTEDQQPPRTYMSPGSDESE